LLQLHHPHGSAVPASDFQGQVFTEDRHFLALGRANMRWKASISIIFTAARRKKEQLGKLAYPQPGEFAAVINPPECQASVTLEAVPAEPSGFESFSGHRLHGIPENRLYMSDFYGHARLSDRPLPNRILLLQHVPESVHHRA
jgi:hypothetical protein